MDPCKVSAQFAAYVWFSSHKTGGRADGDRAVRFAKDNWPAFLPCAHEGIGRLLIRVAELDRKKAGPARRPHAARPGQIRRGRPVAAG
jgi:hypothetical protein